jgi:hypothetical protein
MWSCLDDRKITGSLFGATNLMIPSAGLATTSGALHTFTKTVESGALMTSPPLRQLRQHDLPVVDAVSGRGDDEGRVYRRL